MMEAIIVFFRDLLNGPLYTVVFIVCLILILVCISGIKKNILEGETFNPITNAKIEPLVIFNYLENL